MIKLHVGCGSIYLDGWVNTDNRVLPKVDLHHDARDPFPHLDDSVDFAFNEHFIEHLTLPEGLAFFKEMYRLLRKGGIIRVAAPDLDVTVDQYVNESWRPDFARSGIVVATRCEMLNITLHGWGHKYMYDYEDLALRLKDCGFINIERQEYGKSKYPELCNLENRWPSFLIAEAEK